METNEAPDGRPAHGTGPRQQGPISRDVTVRGAAGCLQWATHVASQSGRVTVAGVSVSGRRNWSIVGGGQESLDGESLTVTVTGTGRNESLDLADALEAASTALRAEIG